MVAAATCSDCPIAPTTPPMLAWLSDQMVALGHLTTRALRARPGLLGLRRRARTWPLRLAELDQRTLDDIHAPSWLYRDLAARQASAQLEDLRLRASYPHWL